MIYKKEEVLKGSEFFSQLPEIRSIWESETESLESV